MYAFFSAPKELRTTDNPYNILYCIVLAVWSTVMVEMWKRKESEICWKVNVKTIIDNGYNLDIKNPIKPTLEKEYGSDELIKMLGKSFEKSNLLLNQLKEAIK